MHNLSKKEIIEEIYQNGWWVLNENEIADFLNEESQKNYDPKIASFLNLSFRKEINDEWLMKIGKLTDLTSLHIDATNVTDEGISELKGLTKLKSLNLRDTNITNKSLITISQLKSLENLWLNKIALNGENLHLLGSLENLDSLFLGNGENFKKASITDKDIEFLFNKKSIKTLSLEYTNISSKSFRLFNSLPNLWYLDVTGSNITDEEIISFMDEKPQMVVHYIDY